MFLDRGENGTRRHTLIERRVHRPEDLVMTGPVAVDAVFFRQRAACGTLHHPRVLPGTLIRSDIKVPPTLRTCSRVAHAAEVVDAREARTPRRDLHGLPHPLRAPPRVPDGSQSGRQNREGDSRQCPQGRDPRCDELQNEWRCDGGQGGTHEHRRDPQFGSPQGGRPRSRGLGAWGSHRIIVPQASSEPGEKGTGRRASTRFGHSPILHHRRRSRQCARSRGTTSHAQDA